MMTSPIEIDNSKAKGFTLIELSIVLVIIGLIVGGVLVGQDLIKAAEVRATVGQIEKYNAAVNTFRTKYTGIPGDLQEAQAVGFGLFALSTAATVGGVGEGDGNGLIEGAAAATNAAAGETLLFWRHLSDAGLVDSQLGRNMVTDGTNTSTAIAEVLAPAKLGRGNYFAVGSASGFNYYVLGGFALASADTYDYTNIAAITPIEAYNIDVKLDDGSPNTGIVVARAPAADTTMMTDAASSAASSTTGNCMVGATTTGTSNTYNRNISSGGNKSACALRFRFN